MRTLLLGVLLGFLTRGQSVPVNDATEIPAKTEADVLREAITDGFIVDLPFDESSKHNSTNPTNVVVRLSDTLNPTSDPEEEGTTQPTSDEADMMEASAPVEGSADYPTSEEDNGIGLYSSLTPSPLPAQSSSYTVLLQTDSEDFFSSTLSSQSMYPGSRPSPMPGVDEQDLFMEETTKSPTTMDLQGVERNSFDALFSTTTTTTHGHYLSDEHKTSIGQRHSSVSHNTEVPVHRFDSSLTTLSPSSTPHVVSSHSPESESVSESEDMLGISPETSFSTTSNSSLILSSSSISGLNSDINTREDEPTAASTATMPPTSTAGVVANAFRGIFMDMEGSGNASDQRSVVPPTTEEGQIEGHVIKATNRPPSAVEQNTPSKRKGHSTPPWVMILAVVVGVAALVLLCIAIATRDRWNGPNQVREKKRRQEEMKANCSNQQRELESFLDGEHPRETGHAEYTVIPLEELTEKEPLH